MTGKAAAGRAVKVLGKLAITSVPGADSTAECAPAPEAEAYPGARGDSRAGEADLPVLLAIPQRGRRGEDAKCGCHEQPEQQSRARHLCPPLGFWHGYTVRWTPPGALRLPRRCPISSSSVGSGNGNPVTAPPATSSRQKAAGCPHPASPSHYADGPRGCQADCV